jgi:threonine/homoserine/homoserine lactone efflux protein
MITLVSQGIASGLSAGVIPGPFQAYTINHALSAGFGKSWLLAFVPLMVDAPLIALIVFVLGTFPADLIRVIKVGGGLYLLWIAYGAFRAWQRGATIQATGDAPLTVERSRWSILRGGVLMGWLSPGPYVFWSTVNGPLLIQGLRESIWQGIAFLLAFYLPFMALITLTAFLFDRLGRLDPRLTRAAIFVTIMVMTLFALSLVWQGFSG